MSIFPNEQYRYRSALNGILRWLCCYCRFHKYVLLGVFGRAHSHNTKITFIKRNMEHLNLLMHYFIFMAKLYSSEYLTRPKCKGAKYSSTSCIHLQLTLTHWNKTKWEPVKYVCPSNDSLYFPHHLPHKSYRNCYFAHSCQLINVWFANQNCFLVFD